MEGLWDSTTTETETNTKQEQNKNQMYNLFVDSSISISNQPIDNIPANLDEDDMKEKIDDIINVFKIKLFLYRNGLLV